MDQDLLNYKWQKPENNKLKGFYPVINIVQEQPYGHIISKCDKTNYFNLLNIQEWEQ